LSPTDNASSFFIPLKLSCCRAPITSIAPIHSTHGLVAHQFRVWWHSWSVWALYHLNLKTKKKKWRLSVNTHRSAYTKKPNPHEESCKWIVNLSEDWRKGSVNQTLQQPILKKREADTKLIQNKGKKRVLCTFKSWSPFDGTCNAVLSISSSLVCRISISRT